MATLTEIAGELQDPLLNAKCAAACLVAANTVVNESGATTNHPNRLKWAKKVYGDPTGQGLLMLRAVLAANNTATLAQIIAASDATIQTAVNANIDVLADGS